MPLNFCRVNPNEDKSVLTTRFPEYLSAIETFATVETGAFHFTFLRMYSSAELFVLSGQMLYLPAGWFHEVTSFGDAGKRKLSCSHYSLNFDYLSENGLHIAFNYWFHPPTSGKAQGLSNFSLFYFIITQMSNFFPALPPQMTLQDPISLIIG